MRSLRIVSTILAMICLSPVRSVRAAEAPLIFETDVRPVLTKKCGKCHNPDDRKGELDLSTMAALRRGGESGEAAVADTADDSLLWIMIDGGGMPPEDQPQLTENERKLIRRWIAGGAHSKAPQTPTHEAITQNNVIPIVLLRCTTCHGPRLRRGGLDMRTPASMRKGGKSGPALVPGNPDASLMIQRIESQACPPSEQLLKYFVKRPTKSEVKVLRDWIAAGAPVAEVAPDVATNEPDPLVTDEDRKHWAFQPPKARPGVDSIDEFIVAKLKAQGLTLSPEADRDTLIRRAYLDLTGLPPDLAEWNQWHNSSDPDWYRNMIEELLASPHYGERWGRYWLDLAGYADSEGGISADPVREVAWKYRDYVVRSFNDDKPYDRFLVEQLAGDELIDYDKADVVTDEMVQNLVATGFLRMGIDQTGSRTMNFVPERLGVINDVIEVVGSGLMGLTMECAKCHSHKYDAIPQRDYYRFKAIFQGALDEHDWLSFKTRKLNVATPEHRKRVAAINPPLQKEIKSLQNKLKRAIADLNLELLRGHAPELSEDDRRATLAALRVADNNRSLRQRNLVEKLQRAEIIPDSQQPASVLAARREVADIEQKIAEAQRKMVPPLTIRALWDRGEPSPTYILRRGEYDKPGRLVGPGVPSVLTDGRTPFVATPPFPNGTPKTGRRLALARWLTKPNHPLTARVMVNRIWHYHFGAGIVESLENFGVGGAAPSHPELLDWLAVRFVNGGWSIKDMHRLMMNSRSYKQISRIDDERLRLDPRNRLLSRMPLRRMDAEALRDSLLFVSGRLVDVPGGPPDSVSIDRDGLVSADETFGDGWRRSIYMQYRRTEIPTMMETFDYPEMGPNCVTRSVSTISPQSLMLMNNSRVHELAASLADRVTATMDEATQHDLGTQVDTVYRLALSRNPSEVERQLGIEALRELKAEWKGDAQAALVTYCHTILNSAAFLYYD